MLRNINCKENKKGENQCFMKAPKSARDVVTWVSRLLTECDPIQRINHFNQTRIASQLLHYKTTKIGCAGAFCVRPKSRLRRRKREERYLKFHCISDYNDKTKNLLFVKDSGWCRSNKRCAAAISDAYCDNDPTTFITHMCYAPPSASQTCNENCKDNPTRKGECASSFHLCSNNLDYRDLTTKVCARTCGRCGLVDRQRRYPRCLDYAEFCRKEEVRGDCRRTCFVKEHLAKGAARVPLRSFGDG